MLYNRARGVTVMKESFRKNFSLYRRETVGFALFLAWVFCTLFGCGLATHESWIDGTVTTYNLEHIWLVSGFFEALGGLAGVVAARFVHLPRNFVRSRAFGIAACACAVAGSVLIWLAWTDRFGAAWAFHVPGGALAGFALALFAVLWSDRISSFDMGHIEFSIPLSFTVAFALYSVLLFTKRGSVSFLVLLLAIIVGSTLLACRKSALERPEAQMQNPVPEQPIPERQARRGLASFGVLACASWVQVAFFRVVSTPELMGSRLTHFLIPFTCACVLSLVMLALCLRHSRYLNISLAYRWSLPLFLLSYVPILIDYGNPTLRLAAYAVNFLGMFGVQFGCWLGACKYLRRQGGDALRVFGAYALGEGLGVFAGCCVGLFAVTLDERGMLVLGTLILVVVLFAVMVTGFNPNWVLNRTGKPARAAQAAPSGADLDAAFEQSARALQQAFDLTNRETDVAALLLAGRSRPFIRDELTVSINTVSSHVRNIFAKCGVHSQQELMDLARSGGFACAEGAADTSAPAAADAPAPSSKPSRIRRIA